MLIRRGQHRHRITDQRRNAAAHGPATAANPL